MAPVPAIGRIEVPAGQRVALAASAVADALVARGAATPVITSGSGDLTVRLVRPFAESPEAFRLRTADGRWSSRRGTWPARPRACTRWPTGSGRGPPWWPTASSSSLGSGCGSPTRARSGARPTRPRSPPGPTTR